MVWKVYGRPNGGLVSKAKTLLKTEFGNRPSAQINRSKQGKGRKQEFQQNNKDSVRNAVSAES